MYLICVFASLLCHAQKKKIVADRKLRADGEVLSGFCLQEKNKVEIYFPLRLSWIIL